jgi:hypothetical protein
MKQNDVVTVMTSVGEYVAKFVKIEDGGVHVRDPRLIVKSPEGEIGFGRGVCMSAVENPPALIFLDCLFVVKANDSFERAYIEATSGILI